MCLSNTFLNGFTVMITMPCVLMPKPMVLNAVWTGTTVHLVCFYTDTHLFACVEIVEHLFWFVSVSILSVWLSHGINSGVTALFSLGHFWFRDVCDISHAVGGSSLHVWEVMWCLW